MAFMPEKHIEDATLELLQVFFDKSKLERRFPIGVEDILEFVYDVIPCAVDLQSQYKTGDAVLGRSMYADGKLTIEVDQTLYPYPPHNHDNMRGRFRYTLAHELGHIKLHLPAKIENAKQANLWDDATPFVFSVFRKTDLVLGGRKPPEEWQADRFAKYLLMPTDMVLAAWEEIFGPNHGPENVFEEMEELRKVAVHPEFVRAQIVRDMAELFDVSAEAMQYRLMDMKLVETERQTQGTFNF